MDANDLFKKSRARFREMSRRSLVMAVRYRLADWETGVDVPKMFAALEIGEVLEMRGVGRKTVQEWRQFVIQKINGPVQYLFEVERGNLGSLGASLSGVSLSNGAGISSEQYPGY